MDIMRKYNLTLPIYQKNKNGKDFLLSMNWYNTTNNFVIDPYKKFYHRLVAEQLKNIEIEKLKQYKTHYKLYIDKTNCDMMNVVSVLDKFVQDGLVKFGLIEDDNVTIYKSFSAECEVLESKKVKGKKIFFGEPRIEIIIEEINWKGEK